MPDKTDEQRGYAAPTSGDTYRISTTRPECLFRHDISDEELTMLVNSSSDGFKDAMYASLGALLGLAPTALNYIYKFVWKGDPIDLLAILNIVIFAMALAAFFCLCLVCKDKKSSARTLSEAIRSRGP